jgi:hypothetical protein
MILLPFASQRQAAAFPQSAQLVDYRAVREEWRRAYRDFKPPADVARRIEELTVREREALDPLNSGSISVPFR